MLKKEAAFPQFFLARTQMSNEKNPGWSGYIGDEILPSFYRDYFIIHYKDPVINQPVFQWKVRDPVFFFRGSNDLVLIGTGIRT